MWVSGQNIMYTEYLLLGLSKAVACRQQCIFTDERGIAKVPNFTGVGDSIP